MMNRVTLVGRLSKDVDLRYTDTGTAVATFTLACNRPFAGHDGKKEADFIPVVVFKKQAENSANFLKKGHLAGVDGRLQVRSYEKDGRRVYVTEVIADSVQFLEPRTQGESAPQQRPESQPSYGGNLYSGGVKGSVYTGGVNVSDDDLPF
jgi:single-strand DNA-binding protein